MKVPALVLLGILLAVLPLAAAQEEPIMELNMTLGEEMEPVDPCVLSGQCAIGHVTVNVTEPPQAFSITGLFAFEAFDFGALLSDIKGFFSGIFAPARA
jgi:hypothetical protein